MSAWRRMVSSVTKRIGHPMSLPRNAWFAWRLDGDFGLYGRVGSQTFNNARIDIGTPGDERFLGGGWSAREGNAEHNFRWTVGRSAFIALPTKAQAPYLVEFLADPFVYPDAPASVSPAPVQTVAWLRKSRLFRRRGSTRSRYPESSSGTDSMPWNCDFPRRSARRLRTCPTILEN